MVARVVRLRAGRIPGPQRVHRLNVDPHGLQPISSAQGAKATPGESQNDIDRAYFEHRV